MTSQVMDMTPSSHLFDSAVFLLSSLVTGPSYMSIATIPGSAVMTIFVYEGLTRNPEIGNTPI